MVVVAVLLVLVAAWMFRDSIFGAGPAVDPPNGSAPQSHGGGHAPPPADVTEVDLLDLASERFASLRRMGSWAVEDGRLVTTRGQASQAWIELPFEPGDSYDIEWVSTRLSGQASMPLFFPTAAGPVSLELDAWREGIAGLQEVNGQDLRQSGLSFPFRYQNGQATTVLLQVRPESVTVTVNGEERLSLELAGRRLGVAGIWQLPEDVGFAVGAWEADARFERLIWRRN